jgi:thiamine kinase-like enzyme
LQILDEINRSLDQDYRVIQQYTKKSTARSCCSMLCQSESSKDMVFIKYTNEEIPSFYLSRASKFSKEFADKKSSFEVLLPIHEGILPGNCNFQIAPYLKHSRFETSYEPIRLLKELLVRESTEVTVTEDTIAQMQHSFLSAWPDSYQYAIRRLDLFQAYFDEVRKFDKIRVSFEHGDFTQNNILRGSDQSLILLDFEFYREFQPIGFDIYDFLTSIGKNPAEEDCFYLSLHRMKYRLIEQINAIVDTNQIDVCVYDDFDKIADEWKKLYVADGHPYNLSWEWCKIWFQHFHEGKKPYVITFWNNDQLELLAPFYMIGKTLYLIGCNPDLYDEFGVLYTKPKVLKKLFAYISDQGLDLEFRYVNSESEIGQATIKWLLQENIPHQSQLIDTKPYVTSDMKYEKKLRSDIKRLKNKVIKDLEDTLEFEFHRDRDQEAFQEFVDFHRQRWGGGPFDQIPQLKSFLEEIYLSTDLIRLSRLYLAKKDETVAYHLGYRNSSQSITSSVPAYHPGYQHISPGKVLLYDLISHAFEQVGLSRFDFGRGAEEYKYWFSNHDLLLFHIKTYTNHKRYNKSKRIVDAVLRRIFHA